MRADAAQLIRRPVCIDKLRTIHRQGPMCAVRCSPRRRWLRHACLILLCCSLTLSVARSFSVCTLSVLSALCNTGFRVRSAARRSSVRLSAILHRFTVRVLPVSHSSGFPAYSLLHAVRFQMRSISCSHTLSGGCGSPASFPVSTFFIPHGASACTGLFFLRRIFLRRTVPFLRRSAFILRTALVLRQSAFILRTRRRRIRPGLFFFSASRQKQQKNKHPYPSAFDPIQRPFFFHCRLPNRRVPLFSSISKNR